MRRGSRALSALLLALAVGLSGCGGDDGGEAEAEALTQEEFIEQADRICADATAEIEAEAESLGDAPEDEAIIDFAAEVYVPSLQEQRDDIEALGAPEGMEEEFDALIDALDEAIGALEEDPGIILGSEDPFVAANDAADALGLVECGSE